MPVIINGTTGISGVDGSASTPAIEGSDTNTGIFFPAADTIGFATSGSEEFRIGPAGQLGIAGANYGTSGQVLTSGGSAASPSWSEATSMTLLGTLTTTTGTTQTLSSLTLTTYKQIVCVFQGVVRSAAFMLVGTSAADDVQCSVSAGATDNGYIWIDLTTGRFATVVGSGIWGSDSVLGTASTSIAFSVSSGSFSGGSILIYGVR